MIVGGIHVLALAAIIPWLFSWTGVALALTGCYTFGTLGINLGFHRLLTHRSFKCSLWFEHALAVIGVCCLEKSPGQFVATHRVHHQHEADDEDPHSPLVTLFWGHMGWLFRENRKVDNLLTYDHYARDVYRDPFYRKLERRLGYFWVYLAHALVFYLVGLAIGLYVSGGSAVAGVQFGLSVLVWHITWSVNSVAHVWGYKNYATRGNSRNNILIGLISNGDGWHNNHHADQRAAAHGHKWWELDVSYITLLVLRKCGLVWDLVPVGVESEPVQPAEPALEAVS